MRERIYSEMLRLINLQVHSLWVKNERRLLSKTSFLLWQRGFETECGIEVVLSIVGDLEYTGIYLLHGFVSVTLFRVLANQERAKIENVLRHHECL